MALTSRKLLLSALTLVLGILLGSVPASAQSAFASASAPGDSKANKSYAKGLKEMDARKYGLALVDFRTADMQSGGRCVACEYQAYRAAILMEDYDTAQLESTALLNHAASPEEKAEAHSLAGDACLGQGGFRIYEEPFQRADGEFQAALQLQPGRTECLYSDGLALAHLHQYDKAKDRFEQFVKTAPPSDFQYGRAKLFATQPDLARKRIVPNFKITTTEGKTISMEQLQGKVVLLDFWATWCGPCKQALPHIKELVKKFDGQPLVVISISLDEDEPTWKSFIAQNSMNWIQYRDGNFDGPIATQFRVKAIPTTFSIDANGFVQDQQIGQGEIEKTLEKLVAQAKEAAGGKTVAEVR
jgi:thiol-disulfide isomerase/thioredoxin